MSPVCVIVCSGYLCGEVMYDGNGDAGVARGCLQRDSESVGYEGLEAPFSADLDQSAAAVTADLRRNTSTQNH